MDKRIGAQYYTIRDYIGTIKDFETSCKKISDIGYKAVQISGTPIAASDMRKVLDEYGLVVYTTHRAFEDFIKNPGEIMEYNRILGSDLCGVGSMPGEYRNTADGRNRRGEPRLGRYYFCCRKSGLAPGACGTGYLQRRSV